MRPAMDPAAQQTPSTSTSDQAQAPVVWITGSSRGIGRAMAFAFGRSGWKVAVQYRERATEAQRVVEDIQRLGGAAEPYQGDVRDAEQMQHLAASIVERWTKLDVVVCNAGIACSRLLVKTEPDEWQSVLDTNLTGVFHTMQAAAPLMIPAGGGHLIVVGSLAGFQGQVGQAAYAASKAGLMALVRSAAREWSQRNIRVNLILPGWQQTDLAGEAFPHNVTETHLLARTADLDEVARTVVHLAGCRDISGQVWNLDSRPLF